MRPAIATLAVLGAVLPLHAHADWQYTKWGMTPEQVVSASKGNAKLIPKEKRDHALGMEEAVGGTFTDGPIRLQVAFKFDSKTNGLVCVGYKVVDKSQNAALKDAMIKRYGPGSKVSIPGMEMISWKKPDNIKLTSTPESDAAVLHCKPD